MRRHVTMSAILIVILAGALVWAAVCPVCLKQIPEGEKYCARHKAAQRVKQMSSQEEKKLAEQLEAARAQYITSLEQLQAFYEGRRDALGLQKVNAELEDMRKVRQFSYHQWEDSLPELSATTPTPEADKLLKEADTIRIQINPFNRARRLREAARKYQEILQKYPTSTAVDEAAFGLGEIYSNSSVGEYKRAVRFYELSYLANPESMLDPLYRAARVCDSDLAAYEDAARFYWVVIEAGRSIYTRNMSARRLRQLQMRGFGTSYVIEEEPAQEPKTEEEDK